MPKIRTSTMIALSAFADYLLEAYWLFVIIISSEQFFYYLILSGLLKIIGYIVLGKVFARNNFYLVYIYAVTFAFILILLVNRLNENISLVYLVVLKEVFSVLRIITTRNLLAQTSSKRELKIFLVNSLFIIFMVLTIPLINYLQINNLDQNTYIYFGLIISVATVFAYNLPKKVQGKEALQNYYTIYISISQKFWQRILMYISVVPVLNLLKIQLILVSGYMSLTLNHIYVYIGISALALIGIFLSRMELIKLRYWESETLIINGIASILIAIGVMYL
jgi:hypothetical protein